jgi:flagellar protein FlaF
MEVVLMGFSVSGAAAIIFLSMFIGFGMLYTATDNSFHEVIDAQDDRVETTLETKNTDINVTSAVFDGGDVTITANNTGATALSLNETTILVDNTYQSGWEPAATVDGNGQTDLWAPGETLTVTIAVGEQPGQVQITTATGVSGTVEVTT